MLDTSQGFSGLIAAMLEFVRKTSYSLANNFDASLQCCRPAFVDEGDNSLGGVCRRCRLSARARVNRIPDRDGSTVAIRRPRHARASP